MRYCWGISPLLKVALLLLSISRGVTSTEYFAPVGKLFEVAVTGGNVAGQEMFPRWPHYNRISTTLFGIPQSSDLGTVSMFLKNGYWDQL